MNLRSVPSVALLASLLAGSAMAQAISEAPQTEEDINYTLPTDEWYVPKNTLSFGVRGLAKGVNVKFGNVGSVNPYSNQANAFGDRSYTDGWVQKDEPRQLEKMTEVGTPNATVPVTTHVVDLGNGRYDVITRTFNSNDNSITNATVGQGIFFVDGQSRQWFANAESQINNANDELRLSTYRAVSQGATFEKDEGMSGGVEVALARQIGRFGNRFEWGLTAGVALNTLNAKTGGTSQATLFRYSDYYRLFGDVPGGVREGPTVDENSIETTIPVSQDPIRNTDEVVGNVDVHGNWQVKGAYFIVRVGPSVRTQVTERFGLSASVGVAGAYSGTRFNVVERMELDLENVLEPIVDDRWDSDSKLLAGFYADVNVDWTATDRTGLFAGVSMQQFGTYNMSVAGRTAKIDLGNSVGLRGGINIKF